MKANRRTRRAFEAQQRRLGTAAALAARVPFPVAGWIVLSQDGRSFAQATAPGSVTILLPVPTGAAGATLADPRIGDWLTSGAAVICACQSAADALALHRAIEARKPSGALLQ